MTSIFGYYVIDDVVINHYNVKITAFLGAFSTATAKKQRFSKTNLKSFWKYYFKVEKSLSEIWQFLKIHLNFY